MDTFVAIRLIPVIRVLFTTTQLNLCIFQFQYLAMETTIRINTDMLNADIVEGIKRMFPHKTVDIIIQPADATDYILSNPAYAKELKERIAEYEAKKQVIAIKPEELL